MKKLALALVVLAGTLALAQPASAQIAFAPVYAYPARVVYRPAYPVVAPVYAAPVYPAPMYVAPGYVARQKVYVPFQPARNVIRAVTPGARVFVY